MIKKPIQTFNLFIKSTRLTKIPRGSSLRVVVNIWRHKKDMHAYFAKDKNHYKLENGEHARTSWHADSKESHIEVNFFYKRMGIEYVAHEFQHAGIFWANYANLNIQTPVLSSEYSEEEIYVRVVSTLIKQFYRRIHKFNLTFAEDLLESRPLDE